jgi:hypothetical protein
VEEKGIRKGAVLFLVAGLICGNMAPNLFRKGDWMNEVIF